MDWDKTYRMMEKMVGRNLKSISGKSDIVLIGVNDEYVTIGAKTVTGKDKTLRRPTKELKMIVGKMKPGIPVHVESDVLRGGGSSRNQPETILANMPDVEWKKVDRRKKILWVKRKTHELGTLRECEREHRSS